MRLDDFQFKIGANPSDSYPIFAKASYWHFAAYCSQLQGKPGSIRHISPEIPYGHDVNEDEQRFFGTFYLKEPFYCRCSWQIDIGLCSTPGDYLMTPVDFGFSNTSLEAV